MNQWTSALRIDGLHRPISGSVPQTSRRKRPGSLRPSPATRHLEPFASVVTADPVAGSRFVLSGEIWRWALLFENKRRWAYVFADPLARRPAARCGVIGWSNDDRALGFPSNRGDRGVRAVLRATGVLDGTAHSGTRRSVALQKELRPQRRNLRGGTARMACLRLVHRGNALRVVRRAIHADGLNVTAPSRRKPW